MKSFINGLISRLDTDEKIISELEGIDIETSKTEKQRHRNWKTNNIISKDYGTITKCVTFM